MLTEVDIERIMSSQRQLAESLTESPFGEDNHNMLDDDELFQMLDTDLSVSETNGLM